MYHAYLGISKNPFALTPDPRFLFMSRHHREALAHLLYGMGEGGGFVQLTGEVGTGKTTLCRSLLEQVPENVDVALILNPKQTAVELVASICDELHVSYKAGTDSLKMLIDLLNRHLLSSHAKGQRTVLIIDEAQNLSVEVLEQLRLLTNLETATQKLLQIILIGQPELQTLMARSELRQLAQRITARYHLTPLLSDETIAYIRHRLEVAGCKQQLFTRGALRLVHKLSRGVPRVVNIVCDRALLGAYALQRESINRALVRKAMAEVMGQTGSQRSRRLAGWATACLLLALVGAGWRFMPWPILTKPQPPAEKQGSISGAAGHVRPETTMDKETLPEPDTEQDPQQASVSEEPAILAELLDGGTVKTDTETAFATLFECWQLAYQDLPGITACERAVAAGLGCLHGRGNWTNLRYYNRPAILKLKDGSRQPHNVVLVALENGDVTLDFAGQQVTLPRAQVAPFWFGGFTLLWNPPPFSASLLREGSVGSDVLWLRAQLEHVEGVVDSPDGKTPSPVFDKILRRRVVSFQRSHGLRPDGVVGAETLIQLNTAAGDSSVPVLCRLP